MLIILRVMQVLLEFCPECVKERNLSGRLPLDIALEDCDSDDECIPLIVNVGVDSTSFRDVVKLLTAEDQCDWLAVECIVKEHIDTIVFEHSADNEPFLNVLLKYNPPVELIQEVIAANPSAVIEKYQWRLTSALTSIKHCASVEVIRAVVKGIFD